MSKLDMLITQVRAERNRQDTKWGEQNHHPGWWMNILMEEVGEASKALLGGDPVQMHQELTEVAAVALATCESIERNGGWPDLTALQKENARLREALEWYGERAGSLAKNFDPQRPGKFVEYCMAIFTELSLDAGRRAGRRED